MVATLLKYPKFSEIHENLVTPCKIGMKKQITYFQHAMSRMYITILKARKRNIMRKKTNQSKAEN